MEEAASIPLVGLTAWQALIDKADLKKGQKVFIQAGSGGVGTFAIQLAKHLGATVATTTSTTNVALVKGLGADVVIDYKTQDFEDVLRDYDVVLNSQDGKTLEKSLRVLKRGGKLISISGPPDPEFGKDIAAPGFVRLVMRLLSSGVRRRAKTRRRRLLVPLHEGEREPIARDHPTHRGRSHPPRDRSGLSIRVDQRGPGLRRSRPRQGQGRRQDQVSLLTPSTLVFLRGSKTLSFSSRAPIAASGRHSLASCSPAVPVASAPERAIPRASPDPMVKPCAARGLPFIDTEEDGAPASARASARSGLCPRAGPGPGHPLQRGPRPPQRRTAPQRPRVHGAGLGAVRMRSAVRSPRRMRSYIGTDPLNASACSGRRSLAKATGGRPLVEVPIQRSWCRFGSATASHLHR